MSTEILMPALSPTMTEGNLVRWAVKEGDQVNPGDIIAEIETDKATMEVEAIDEGIVGKILVPEGSQNVKVNDVIAVLLGEGESAEDVTASSGKSASGKAQETEEVDTADEKAAAEDKPGEPAEEPQPKANQETRARKTEDTSGIPATPLARRMAEQAGLSLKDLKATGAGGKISKTDVEAALSNRSEAAPAERSKGDRVFASPLARHMAREAQLELSQIPGSGPNGRIIKVDVERAMREGTAAKAEVPPEKTASASQQQPQQAPEESGLPPFELVQHTGMRKVIAKRLTESKQTIPHFYLTIDCEIDQLLATRKQLNAMSDVKVSVNDFVIKAVAVALKRVPEANASWTEEGVRRFQRVDIANAVAVANGLVTPVVRGADALGLARIAERMQDLAKRARDGKLKPEEYQGGTFSISNLGMFGIRQFDAVINPPQAGILAVGAGEQRPIVKDGELKIATVMTCTLSCDHRVIDGAIGAQLLSVFKPLIENPATMLL